MMSHRCDNLQLAAALNEFTSDGSWAPINLIAVPYLSTDVSEGPGLGANKRRAGELENRLD